MLGRGECFGAQRRLTFLPFVFSFVPLSLPLTHHPSPRRLQQLLEERERDEEVVVVVVEEVEDVRFVTASTLLLPFPLLYFHFFCVLRRYFLTWAQLCFQFSSFISIIKTTLTSV